MNETATPSVTILVSVYNQAGSVGEAISAALAQTVPTTVRVFDDGSSDDSAAIAAGFGVDVVSLPHRGALATFRSAAESVETEFFMILNGDDTIDENFVGRTLAAINNPRVAIAYTDIAYCGARIGIERAIPYSPTRLRWKNYIHGSSLVRTEAYREAGGYDPYFSDTLEDWALWVAIHCRGWRAVRVPEPLLRYRIHTQPSRNQRDTHVVRAKRWRLARKHASCYGLWGLSVLLAMELAAAGRDVARALLRR